MVDWRVLVLVHTHGRAATGRPVKRRTNALPTVTTHTLPYRDLSRAPCAVCAVKYIGPVSRACRLVAHTLTWLVRLSFVWGKIYWPSFPLAAWRHSGKWTVAHTLTWLAHPVLYTALNILTWYTVRCSDGGQVLTHTLTWVVRPMFCMVLNILT